jgi:proteasome lid subunit RPN8/RPN11
VIDFPERVLREIAAHAQSTYPEECCGLVLARPDGALEFVAIPNVAGAEARKTSDRTARDGYVMDPAALLKALSRWGEEALRVIVHSHPDVGAYFSKEDRNVALGGGTDPLWPGVEYLVVSCRKGTVDDARLYSWDPAGADFREWQVPITSAFR